MTKGVFLDRDGVLNKAVLRGGKPYPPQCLEELVVFPDARAALDALRRGGYLLVVTTNQPDIARGLVTAERVAEINLHLQRYLQLDGVGLCPHDDSARCSCRKPQPGLLLEAARVWDIDLETSYIVGDRWRDIEAGHRAGCRAIFVDYGYAEQRPDGPFVQVRSLREAANWILRTARPGHLLETPRYA